jgi:hypothetical protein
VVSVPQSVPIDGNNRENMGDAQMYIIDPVGTHVATNDIEEMIEPAQKKLKSMLDDFDKNVRLFFVNRAIKIAEDVTSNISHK